MLVLSRREKEKVKFPTLGITIEVIRTGSNKVQLGIDAPREIRVIREELEDFNESFQPQIPNFQVCELRQQLDSVSMAIHLAQNQLRQGLDVKADEALDQAVSILNKLEARFEPAEINGPERREFVRENRSSYQTRTMTTSLPEFIRSWFRSSFI